MSLTCGQDHIVALTQVIRFAGDGNLDLSINNMHQCVEGRSVLAQSLAFIEGEKGYRSCTLGLSPGSPQSRPDSLPDPSASGHLVRSYRSLFRSSKVLLTLNHPNISFRSRLSLHLSYRGEIYRESLSSRISSDALTPIFFVVFLIPRASPAGYVFSLSSSHLSALQSIA